ncbi:D-3-phosphoglycerate dehydrogenase [Thermosporothrix hazakensis]|jgi:D-3-phosphoglycerate dehydrogenase|uniref:D-3-phosphoglycerate dehydrogenase n=1 Tax=Thermosporothrix hazakensis TaxID=644383 RepID=A0A326UGW8_THEHA|nr:phosphoglycerate dehydrogenase [Thermosporothrix hazakensis]PZW30610.1 D-3-phosphoglycerate dehydrogenase [Thermosporothrix hazakensis]GCE49472.1 phosphoglycerate dehydrogenase [Thermosporothrix hazakensis]
MQQAEQAVKVLITDKVAREGIALLQEQLPTAQIDERRGLSKEQLQAIIGDYHALIVRSETQVTADILTEGKNLRIVGRAGVGVDNIDTEAATRLGIIVVNSPTGNIIAAAEHSIAMLMSLARHIPAANASTKAGKWEKSRFLGVEVRNKVLGVIGLGKVGMAVARRAQGLEMQIVAYDPFVSPEHAQKSGIEMLDLDELLRRSDFVTIHTSLTSGPSGTRGLIAERELSLMKPTARLINCARGGIVNEEDLLKALNENRLAGAALDVFSQEPIRDNDVLKQLVAHERVIATPHLGASTEEAQVSVAVDVAEQVVSVLKGGFPRAAVNAPMILPETMKVLQPYMTLLEKMGSLYTQLQPGPLTKIELIYNGEIASYDLRPLQAALIKGLLEPISEVHVNQINAQVIAKEWGLEIIEQKSTTPAEFANQVTLRVLNANGYTSSFAGKPGSGDEHVETLSGTVMHDEPRIVRVGRYWTDFAPEGRILFCRNLDQPGMIGRVGMVLGKAAVNIRHMDVGPSQRKQQVKGTHDTALMVISVDNDIPEWALHEIGETGDIFGVTVVHL